MSNWFKSQPFVDPDLGELRRTKGMWRGALALGEARLPLALAGSRGAPDPDALRMGRSVAAHFESWRPSLERALFEHYAPYAEVAEEEAPSPHGGPPPIAAPADVWLHTTAEFIRIGPLDGQLTIEIGYRVAWDEEHTLGARFRNGQLVELCGSVLTAS